MERLNILMNRERFAEWAAAHPLGSALTVSVADAEVTAVVAGFCDCYGKVEVRMRLTESKEK